MAAVAPVGRAAPARAGAAGRTPEWIARLLAMPLVLKVTGASMLVVAAAIAGAFAVQGRAQHDVDTVLIMVLALGTSMCVNVGLVLLALRPIQSLKETAERVAHGDLDARVPASPLADRDIARVADTLNHVLDELIADREHMRRLASAVIREGDRQRSSISRELHDSAAQSLAALMFEVTAAARSSTDPDQVERLEAIRGYAVNVLDEVRLLAQRVHPRVLEDLGLAPALERLARGVRESSDARVEVCMGATTTEVPRSAASVLFRVAEEAVANAVRHGAAEEVSIHVSSDARNVRLAVIDDGRGFDPSGIPANHPGSGLFTMRQRVLLAGGIFEVDSQPGAGTVVSAVVPLEGAP